MKKVCENVLSLDKQPGRQFTSIRREIFRNALIILPTPVPDFNGCVFETY